MVERLLNTLFLFFFSTLWPCSKHFFLLSLIDNSVSYSPESKIIFDIPTALHFFSDPIAARRIVGEKTADLCHRWNEQFSKNLEVRTKLILGPPYNIAC